MKEVLDYQDPKIVNIFDEVNLWTAPFGRLLLENIPMRQGMTILDVGFGTGFPLVELSQRFGDASQIYGIDIWKGGIIRTREKIKTLGLKNITILEESASKIAIKDDKIDLITSNLGINNFEEREKVYSELYRILKKGGRVAITTNPIGTFNALFDVFEEILLEMDLSEARNKLADYVANRNTKEQIVQEFAAFDFKLVKEQSDSTNMRFMSGQSLLNHSLMRVGFREGWNQLINEEDQSKFYGALIARLDAIVAEKGGFEMRVPLLYLEFEK